ncbi:unnamed protein product, partial [Choristocarpus tenellus]
PRRPVEIRRAWQQRRQRGQFYFRSEFNGLVAQVMRSRGWKRAGGSQDDGECRKLDIGVAHHSSNIRSESSTVSLSDSGSDSLLLSGNSGSESALMSEVGLVLREHSLSPKENPESRRKGRDDNEDQWDVHWSYMKWAVETMRFAKLLMPWQKVNHFRNSKELCRKDLMLKNLKKRRAQLLGTAELVEGNAYNFFPTSFVMPKASKLILCDYALFVEEFKLSGGIWIMKPSGSAEGKGIFLVTKLAQVKAWETSFLAQAMRR